MSRSEKLRLLVGKLPAGLFIGLALLGFWVLSRGMTLGSGSIIGYAEEQPHAVGPLQPGRLKEVRVTLGQAVKAGEVLAILDSRPLELKRARLQAELAQAKAQLLADKPLLTAVLKYHVLSGTVRKAAVPLGAAITPLEGGIFKVDAVGSDLVITDGRNRTSTIRATDIAASNGVVHVIDRVLLPADKNIVQTAQALPQFSILVEAVVAADLQGALSGTGPLTVFAPTNAAFAALLTELGVTKAQLLADKALLTTVLTYHVLPGTVRRADIPLGKAVTTVQGGIFKVDAVGTTLKITDGRNRTANITATDLSATNGVVHVIDKVILPANKNIVQTAQALPDFSILVEAVVAADLQGTLSGTGPFTVFAPTNAAFAKLPAGTVDNLVKPENKALLTSILTYHVVSGKVMAKDVKTGAVPTVNGQSINITAGAGGVAVNDAKVTATDVAASNCVIHVVDTVLMPK